MAKQDGYTQEYCLENLGYYGCASMHPKNPAGVYEDKILLVPEKRLGNKLWGQVDYLVNYCKWTWRTATKDLLEQSRALHGSGKKQYRRK
jgi:hypothetical protein